jgi:hypothetical protein
MSKVRVTKKSIKESYDTILKIGYCNLQFLLKYEEPFAYSTRVEGWACDYYRINNVCISTGYDPIGQSVPYELQKRYNEEAEKIACDYSLTWEQQKEKVNALLIEFVNEVVK